MNRVHDVVVQRMVCFLTYNQDKDKEGQRTSRTNENFLEKRPLPFQRQVHSDNYLYFRQGFAHGFWSIECFVSKSDGSERFLASKINCSHIFCEDFIEYLTNQARATKKNISCPYCRKIVMYNS